MLADHAVIEDVNYGCALADRGVAQRARVEVRGRVGIERHGEVLARSGIRQNTDLPLQFHADLGEYAGGGTFRARQHYNVKVAWRLDPNGELRLGLPGVRAIAIATAIPAIHPVLIAFASARLSGGGRQKL